MSSEGFEGLEGSEGIAKKACLRCRSHKRKCDRALPKCSLCLRLRQFCKYDSPYSPQSTSPASQGSGPEILLHAVPLTTENIKTAIVQSLTAVQPVDIANIYAQTIEPWFPIFSETVLVVSGTWDDASLEFSLLAKAIVLLSTSPEPGSDNDRASLNFMQSYLSLKGWVGLLEGMGTNSLEFVQTRLLITLFEVGHGFYPAAYTSIGSTYRAAEALVAYSEPNVPPQQSLAPKAGIRERVVTWCGIYILDKYIATESGKWKAATFGRDHPEIAVGLCIEIVTMSGPSIQRFSRLFEASGLLESVHNALHTAVQDDPFSLELIIDCVKDLSTYETLIHQTVPESLKLYASDLTLCTIGLLRSFEAGSKASPKMQEIADCFAIAAMSLDTLIEVIFNMTELFVSGRDVMDMNILSPFIIYLIYKTAAIVTESLHTRGESVKCLQRLRSFRRILKMISKRWYAAERYLQMLNEDTTPRVLRAIENEAY